MKKLVSLALAAVLAVSAVGCGSSSDSSSSTADSAQSTEAAADGATFKIGGIGPITGGAAIYGQAVMNAAQMAVDKINADGGINGYQVEFRFEDDEHDAEKSVNAYNTLKDWGMHSPAPLAIPALTESRCGTLVRIDGVRYTPEDLSAATWAGYKRFTDADGNAVYTYVRRYARFADAEVPAGTVSLTGILQYDAAGDGRYILKLRDENDCTH